MQSKEKKSETVQSSEQKEQLEDGQAKSVEESKKSNKKSKILVPSTKTVFTVVHFLPSA